MKFKQAIQGAWNKSTTVEKVVTVGAGLGTLVGGGTGLVAGVDRGYREGGVPGAVYEGAVGLVACGMLGFAYGTVITATSPIVVPAALAYAAYEKASQQKAGANTQRLLQERNEAANNARQKS